MLYLLIYVTLRFLFIKQLGSFLFQFSNFYPIGVRFFILPAARVAAPQPNGVNLRKTQLIVYECESELHAYKCAFNRLKEYIIRENRVIDLDNLTLTNINKPP